MKACIFEDDDSKYNKFVEELHKHGIVDKDIVRVSNISESVAALKNRYDIFLVDLFMPYCAGDEITLVGKQILKLLDGSEGFNSEVLIVTEFESEVREVSLEFAGRGCVTAAYQNEVVWKSALHTLLQKVVDRRRYDFLIFCAADVEVEQIHVAGNLVPKVIKRDKVVYEEFTLGGYQGAIVQLPRMGLVNAAVVTAKVLETFSPKVVCMSGICGGIGEGKIGQLLVTDICWEYQSGKWTDEGLQSEAYQVSLDKTLRAEIVLVLKDKRLLQRLEKGFSAGAIPTSRAKPKLSVFSSGSSVLARKSFHPIIKSQQRKVSGIDMEIYAFHTAAEYSRTKPICFSAKTVADRADRKKTNKWQKYGSFISARFCLLTTERLLQQER